MLLHIVGWLVLAVAGPSGGRDFIEDRSVGAGGSPHLDSAFFEGTESFEARGATSPSTKLAVQTGDDGSVVLSVDGIVWLSSSTPSLFMQGLEVRIILHLI